MYVKYLRFVKKLTLLQCKSEDPFIWVIYPLTFSVQNFNINIKSIECYEKISAIGKEVESFPATFDFSIVFKSKY